MRATLTFSIRGARSKNNSECSTFGKIRIVLGICFNVWLLYCYGKDLLNGGMYDSDWDYYYHLTPQYFIIVSCCVSLFSDCMLYYKKDKTYLYENIAQMVPLYRSVGTARSGSVVPLISV